jgi:predicted nucleic acid-binding protein
VKWVLDASVAVRWYLQSEEHRNAQEVLGRLLESPFDFAVPELFAFEVLAVLCRAHAEPIKVYREGVLPLLHGGMYRQPMTERLAVAAAGFAERGLSGYDACYASLAHDLHATWLTFDSQAHRLLDAQGVSHLLADGMPPNW